MTSSILVEVLLLLQKLFNFFSNNVCRYKKLSYICTHNNGRYASNVIGRLAQLVQSTSFTPRGSGVRIPYRPQKKHTDKKNYRAISSAGSEHLVYTEGVRGSNPLSPTKALNLSAFLFYGKFKVLRLYSL